MSDVGQSIGSIEAIESVTGINKKYRFGGFRGKKLSAGMNSSLDTSNLASTQLGGTSCFLYITFDDKQDGFRYYTPVDFTNAYRTHHWVLV